jgi:hypothetical protein
MPQYSAVSICDPIVDITSIQCALYCKLGAKYSAHRPVYAVWNVVPDIYKVLTAPHIYASIFSCRHLRCYSRFHMKSMPVTLQTSCQIQRTTPVYAMWTVVPAIYNVFPAPDSQATILKRTYLRCNWRYCNTSMRVILRTWCKIQRTSSNLRYANCGPGNIQCKYSSAYSDFNIHFERIIAAIVDITSIQCALYCKLGAKYSAHPPVYAMWSVVPSIYKLFTAPDSQATIFNWTYLRSNWRSSNTSMRVILQA